LEECAEEYAIILLGADGAQATVVELVAQALSLEDLGLTFTAALAQHTEV